MKKIVFDYDHKLLLAMDPDRLTPQQRGNITLLDTLLEQEFERGFWRGMQIARDLGVDNDGLRRVK